MVISMELARVIISEINNQQVIYLREVGGTREFFIVIGIFEATCIDRRIKGISSSRPLTHDLICGICKALEAELLDITITRLEEQTFYAMIRLQLGERVIELDARPSDAVTLAITCQPPLPIFVEEEVLLQATSSL